MGKGALYREPGRTSYKRTRGMVFTTFYSEGEKYVSCTEISEFMADQRERQKIIDEFEAEQGGKVRGMHG